MQLIVKAIQNLLASKLKSKRNVSLLHFHNKLIDKQSIILLSILPHLTISITKLSESYFILLIHLLCHFSPYLLIIRSISRHMLPLPVSNQLSPLSPSPIPLSPSHCKQVYELCLVTLSPSLYHYYQS